MINLKRFFLDEKKNLLLLNSRGEDFTDQINQIKELLLAKKNLLFILEKNQQQINLLHFHHQKKIESDHSLYEKLSLQKKIIKNCQGWLKALNADLQQLMIFLPNLPTSKKSKENYLVDEINFPFHHPSGLSHWTIAQKLNWVENYQAVKFSKSRFLIYLNQGALLVRVLKNFMLDQHIKRGYQELVVPYLVKEEALLGTGQFPKMYDDCFKIEQKDLFLLPTSEVALVNFVQGKTFSSTQLPIKLCAYSPCFRQEAGAAGQETKGLVRLHQFHKVEIVQICASDKSDQVLETMLLDASNILNLLQIPYRIVDLKADQLGHAASKTYDLEVWMPSQKKYLEVASLSNTTDFQAQFLKIKYYSPDQKKNQLAHTLNGSGLAIDRLIAVLLEYYYDLKTNLFAWPDVLKPYLLEKNSKYDDGNLS